MSSLTQMLLFSTTEELGVSRKATLQAVEALLSHVPPARKALGLPLHDYGSNKMLSCPREVPHRVLKWALRLHLLRNMLPSSVLDELEAEVRFVVDSENLFCVREHCCLKVYACG